MKILELFCGTKSFSKVALERGHEVFTVDINPKFEPDLCKDILNTFPSDIPFKPNFIWASPPCTTFSVASIYRYWKDGHPKNAKAFIGLAIVSKTIELIKELNPDFWLIENPRGMLRKQKIMEEFKRDTVTYCQYGHRTQKPTDLWNNLNTWNPRPMCKPGASCHERASRGAKKGIQGIYSGNYHDKSTAEMRAVVPRELCLEILKAVENDKNA